MDLIVANAVLSTRIPRFPCLYLEQIIQGHRGNTREGGTVVVQPIGTGMLCFSFLCLSTKMYIKNETRCGASQFQLMDENDMFMLGGKRGFCARKMSSMLSRRDQWCDWSLDASLDIGVYRLRAWLARDLNKVKSHISVLPRIVCRIFVFWGYSENLGCYISLRRPQTYGTND